MDVWTDRLSEYLDGTLAGSERAALDAHLAGCAACAATLEELRRVVARAQNLQDRSPATDLWPGVAERIGVSPDIVSLPARRARRVALSIPQLIAAGLALIVLGSGGGGGGAIHPHHPGELGGFSHRVVQRGRAGPAGRTRRWATQRPH